MIKLDNPPKIIVALDISLKNIDVLLPKLKSCESALAGYKVGALLSLQEGLPKTVSSIRKHTELPIIYDAQKGCTDIPSIVKEQVEVIGDCGVEIIIGAPMGAGPVTQQAFIEASFENNMLPIIVLEMTHPGSSDYLKDGASEEILKLALESKVKDFVAPANKPERLQIYKNIARDLSKEIRIHSPGVGPQGGGPASAVESGADFIISGRGIFDADSPVAAVEKMYSEIIEAYNKRNNK